MRAKSYCHDNIPPLTGHLDRVECVIVADRTGGGRQRAGRLGVGVEAAGRPYKRAGATGQKRPAHTVYANPSPIPRAPDKRISGQMARFTVFQKEKPGSFGLTGLLTSAIAGSALIRRPDAVRFLQAGR